MTKQKHIILILSKDRKILRSHLYLKKACRYEFLEHRYLLIWRHLITSDEYEISDIIFKKVELIKS